MSPFVGALDTWGLRATKRRANIAPWQVKMVSTRQRDKERAALAEGKDPTHVRQTDHSLFDTDDEDTEIYLEPGVWCGSMATPERRRHGVFVSELERI